MRHRYLVADQNYLRSPELQSLLDSDPALKVVLPDLGFFEMAKGDRAELTVRLSLRTLSQYPKRILLARAVGQAMRFELDHKRPIPGMAAPRRLTKLVQEVLEDLRLDPDTSAVSKLLDQPPEQLEWLKRQYLDHEDNKARALELLQSTKTGPDAEFVRRVRSGRSTFEERLEHVSERAPSMLYSVLVEKQFSFSRERALHFIRTKPLLLRYFYLNMWALLDWEEKGRLEGLSPKKVTNDYLDREYVLAASYFDGLLTKEEPMNVAYRAMSLLLQRRV
jgi:hypothetical protein